jgi:hypothetical protein
MMNPLAAITARLVKQLGQALAATPGQAGPEFWSSGYPRPNGEGLPALNIPDLDHSQ